MTDAGPAPPLTIIPLAPSPMPDAATLEAAFSALPKDAATDTPAQAATRKVIAAMLLFMGVLQNVRQATVTADALLAELGITPPTD